MPDKWTFNIKPINKLIFKYGGDFKGWIDPFAGMNSPAEFTNDINPEMNTIYHLESFEFAQILKGQYNGCLHDPPYSIGQVMESYKGYGYEQRIKYDRSGMYHQTKTEIAKKIKTGGYTISFGWSSAGFGKKRGFKIIEILLVAHGRGHYDTICTVERKFRHELNL